MIRFTRPNSLTLCGMAAACVLVAAVHAQATLPATATTAVTPSQLPSANPAIPPASAVVRWDGHVLRVTASGESLSQVFAQIAQQTGLRISGASPSDPVYGSYGPASLQDIVSELVSGLPVNMLFVDRMGSQPASLTFTARVGGATPADSGQATVQQPAAYTRPQVQPAQQSFSPAQEPPNGGAANPGFAPNGAPLSGAGAGQPSAASSQPSDGSANPASPNGVKTPQEIFEQLQRLRANAGAQH